MRRGDCVHCRLQDAMQQFLLSPVARRTQHAARDTRHCSNMICSSALPLIIVAAELTHMLQCPEEPAWVITHSD